MINHASYCHLQVLDIFRWTGRSTLLDWTKPTQESSLHPNHGRSPITVRWAKRVPWHWQPTLAIPKQTCIDIDFYSGPEVKRHIATAMKASTTFGQEASTHCPPKWLFAAQNSRQQKFRHCSINHVSPDYCDPMWDLKIFRVYAASLAALKGTYLALLEEYKSIIRPRMSIDTLIIILTCIDTYTYILHPVPRFNLYTLIPAPGP